MIGIIIAILLAIVIYWLVAALTGSAILAIVAAVLVLLCGVGYGYGYNGRGAPPP